MAEGLANFLLKDATIQSGGTKPEPVNSFAIRVMDEIDIDIKHHYSKKINQRQFNEFDFIITLCGSAKEECILIEKAKYKHIHWPIEDPALTEGSNDNKLNSFRNARDEIKKRIKLLDIN